MAARPWRDFIQSGRQAASAKATLGESKRQPIPDFPAKKSAEDIRLEFDQFAAEKKQSVFELHSFVLYMAAVELDIAALE